MTATITPIRPNVRIATPARWRAALKRAFDGGITLFQIAGTGEAVATSASNPGIAYRTNGVECECDAAQLGGDPVSKHWALYHCTNDTLDPDPPAGPDAVLEALAARVGVERFAPGSDWLAEQAVGIAVAGWLDWDGVRIARLCAEALQDANFHDLAAPLFVFLNDESARAT